MLFSHHTRIMPPGIYSWILYRRIANFHSISRLRIVIYLVYTVCRYISQTNKISFQIIRYYFTTISKNAISTIHEKRFYQSFIYICSFHFYDTTFFFFHWNWKHTYMFDARAMRFHLSMILKKIILRL